MRASWITFTLSKAVLDDLLFGGHLTFLLKVVDCTQRVRLSRDYFSLVNGYTHPKEPQTMLLRRLVKKMPRQLNPGRAAALGETNFRIFGLGSQWVCIRKKRAVYPEGCKAIRATQARKRLPCIPWPGFCALHDGRLSYFVDCTLKTSYYGTICTIDHIAC